MLEKKIKKAIKEKKATLGYRKSLKLIKLGKVKEIIMSKNIPESWKKEIEYNAKLNKIKINVFDGTSKELGVVCGKPFPVTVITIKG